MILWTIKLLNTAKKAIAGRKYPHQLAWATAFGLLLGIVPHGNLAAVAILVLVLSLKINHAMVALTAIATTFLVATRIDPLSHMIGDVVLTHPVINSIAVSAWRLPLIPWTDLNNTVVFGSLLIGVTSLVPVFVISYPVFRLFAPAVDSDAEISEQDDARERSTAQRPADARKKQDSDHQIVMVDRGHDRVASPHSGETVDFQEVPSESTHDDPVTQVAVQTRIDVIRMKGSTTVHSEPSVGGGNTEQSSTETQASKEQPMDEALNYLLRQLRDSQQRSAA